MRTQWLAGSLALVMLSSCAFIVDRQRLVQHHLSATVVTPNGLYNFQCTNQWRHPTAYLGLNNIERITCSNKKQRTKLELSFQSKSTDPFLLHSPGILSVNFTSFKPQFRMHQFAIQAHHALESNQSEYIYFDRILKKGIGISGHWHKQSK